MRFQLHLQTNARGVGNATVSLNRTKNFGIAAFFLAVGLFIIIVCAPIMAADIPFNLFPTASRYDK